MKFATLFVLTAIVAACSGSENATAGRVGTLCQEKLNVPDGVCRCISKKADADLNANQRRLLVAMLSKDTQTSEKLRSEMPVAEVMQTGMFMTSAPGQCAAQGAEK